MPRVLALFLACALLFQTSWAVAAAYCAHETSGTASMHFGHHVHVHPSVDGKQQPGGTMAVDDDCSGCHAGHAALVPDRVVDAVAQAATAVRFTEPLMHGSALARAPDRPQWLRLA